MRWYWFWPTPAANTRSPPDMRIAVRGAGPALVMIHGWAMHSGVFAPLSERLERRFTLHLVDLPGHGDSRESAVPLELDAVSAAIAERVPGGALWLGWSLGGLVALQAAQRFSATVRGLIMLCASPRFVRGGDWPLGMDATVFEGFAKELSLDYRAALDRFLMLEAQGSERLREDFRRLRDAVSVRGEPLKSALLDGLSVLQGSDLRALLPTLSAPSLWIAGRRDRLVSPEAMHAAAALTPRSEFVRIESGGHAPFLSHSEHVAAAIEAFAEGLPA